MCALCGRERKKMKQCRESEEESTHWKRENSTKNGDKKERQKCERLGWAHSKAQSTQRNDTTIKCDTMKQNKPNRLVKRFDLAEAVLGFLSLMSIPKLSLEWMCVCVRFHHHSYVFDRLYFYRLLLFTRRVMYEWRTLAWIFFSSFQTDHLLYPN